MIDEPRRTFSYSAVGFDALRGWSCDDHAAALRAFAGTLEALQAHSDDMVSGKDQIQLDLIVHCAAAAGLCKQGGMSAGSARRFFEQRFQPHRVIHEHSDGLLTGYYGPVLRGSRQASPQFLVPLLRRPPDLITLVDDALRGADGDRLTHARRCDDELVAYASRSEIEQGALDAFDLPLVYLEDPVEAFFLHVQGSGLIELDDGRTIRVGYDGKNGHPYTSVGQYVIGQGEISSSEMTLDRLKAWLRADPERAKYALWQNASYIFFRELGLESATQPLGVWDIPLTPLRSLAVDNGCHALGLPIFVDAPELIVEGDEERGSGFAQLMVAQDVGSAIRGAERGDIYFGEGDVAGLKAGQTKHRGNFFALLPKSKWQDSEA